MQDDFYTCVLKEINCCEHTALEKLIKDQRDGSFRVRAYEDSYKRLRVVLSTDGVNVSGILFDECGAVSVRYTREEYRGQRLSKQLFAWACAMFPKRNLRHSEYLTKAGIASL